MARIFADGMQVTRDTAFQAVRAIRGFQAGWTHRTSDQNRTSLAWVETHVTPRLHLRNPRNPRFIFLQKYARLDKPAVAPGEMGGAKPKWDVCMRFQFSSLYFET
jgi:hypothetical protein